MARWYGKTTDRGYGAAHVSLRAARVKAWRPGDPCAHCHGPIWYLWLLLPDGRRVTAVNLPHNDTRTGYLPGLAHRECNLRDGQAKTTAINRARGRPTQAQLAAIRWRQWQASARQGAR